jgi:hypothetical protein
MTKQKRDEFGRFISSGIKTKKQAKKSKKLATAKKQNIGGTTMSKRKVSITLPDGRNFDLLTEDTTEEIQSDLAEIYPEVENAEVVEDEDSIKFVVKAGKKG